MYKILVHLSVGYTAVCPFWTSLETLRPPMKGDPMSSTYKWFSLGKQKHIDDCVKVIIHYNKCSCVYDIPFLSVYNCKSYTVGL